MKQTFSEKLLGGSLVFRIFIGLVLGLILALISPSIATDMGFLGSVFVKALKAIAPILVFFLVLSAIANRNIDSNAKLRPIIVLYLVGTFLAALTAVTLSFMFPSELQLVQPETKLMPPQGVAEILKTLAFNIVSNPIEALANANFIGILAWAIGLGLVLRHANQATKDVFHDISEGVSMIVRVVIAFAPVGIFGLVSSTIASNGISAFLGYLHLLAVLLGAMFIVAFVLNPLIVYIKTKENPYPLVFRCLRESGISAFFTRSSAANIPVNMSLCEKLGVNKELYSVSIPLGATINMAGAAITITVLTLAAAHTQGITPDFTTALLLSIVASICACGASGVAGGSLLLIPLACALFDIPAEIAMQVIGVGFIIGVVQDSAETALNSSTDVLFTAAVDKTQK